MKKLNLTNNSFLKVLSVLTAIIVWLVVLNISDAETTEHYTLPVTLINTDVIMNNGKVFRVEDGTDSVRLTVRARQSIIRELKESDFILTADMEKDLKFDSMVGITVKCKNNAIQVDEDITLSRSNVKVSIEDSAMEQFPVYVSWTGTPNDGVVVGSLIPEQTVIKITGPVSIVERIKTVEAVVDITGLPATAVRTCSLKLYNSDREEIDATYLNFTGKKDGIDVTVSMLNTKSVPLTVSYEGTPEENYHITGIDWKPEFVEIAGTSEVLSGISSIQIPKEAVNVDGISKELQLVIDLTSYLPSGVILTDETSASVLVIVGVEYIKPDSENETGDEKPDLKDQEKDEKDQTTSKEDDSKKDPSEEPVSKDPSTKDPSAGGTTSKDDNLTDDTVKEEDTKENDSKTDPSKETTSTENGKKFI